MRSRYDSLDPICPLEWASRQFSSSLIENRSSIQDPPSRASGLSASPREAQSLSQWRGLRICDQLYELLRSRCSRISHSSTPKLAMD